MKAKKLAIMGLFIALVVMSVFSVAADSDSDTDTESDVENVDGEAQDEIEGEVQDEVEDTDEVDGETSDGPRKVKDKIKEKVKEHPGFAYGKYSETERAIKWIMEENGLTKESTIAELLRVLAENKKELESNAMEKYGVENTEELKEAIADDRIAWLREELGMDESATAEEVIEEAQRQRMDLIKDLLDLDESATEEEVKAALKEWREENKHLFKARWKFKLFGLF